MKTKSEKRSAALIGLLDERGNPKHIRHLSWKTYCRKNKIPAVTPEPVLYEMFRLYASLLYRIRLMKRAGLGRVLNLNVREIEREGRGARSAWERYSKRFSRWHAAKGEQ